MTKIKPFMCAMCGGGHSDAQSALACCAQKNDVVERPSHYNQGGIECIEAIEASMSREEYKGYLKGSVLKYVWRYQHKGKPVEDLRKANWFLDRLRSVVADEE